MTPVCRYAIAIALFVTLPLHAATVTTNADSGAGSLRDAIATASAGDVIDFDAAGLSGGQTIALTSGSLKPTVSLTISGAGGPAVSIVNATSRVFEFSTTASGSAVTVDSLSLQGSASDGSTGGAVRLSSSSVIVTLSNDDIVGALTTATRGGAISLTGSNSTIYIDHCSVHGSVTTASAFNNAGGAFYVSSAGSGGVIVSHSTISGSLSGAPAGENEGGAISIQSGLLTITDSSISGSSADVGGGINQQGGTMTLSDVTISGNTATSNGGGIYIGKGAAILSNVTIAGNSANTGGGVYADFYSANSQSGTATTTLTNVTIAQNVATNASALYVGFIKPTGHTGTNTTTLINSLVSGGVGRQTGADITDANTQLNARFSLFDATPSEGAGNVLNGTDMANLLGVDPQLGALQNNGGTTQTAALGDASPAIGTADASACPSLDQRGKPRLGNCDIGAFESQGDRLFFTGFENGETP